MIPLVILAIENDADREFMISIYTEFCSMMKAVAMQVVKDEDIAEDIVHDATVALIRKLDVIRGFERERLKSYINRTVHHTALNLYHKLRKGVGNTYYDFDNESAEAIPDPLLSPEEKFEIQEEYENMGKIIKQLPERERELLYLKYFMMYNDETIGDIMGIKRESVRQYLTRARRMAKALLLREGNESE